MEEFGDQSEKKKSDLKQPVLPDDVTLQTSKTEPDKQEKQINVNDKIKDPNVVPVIKQEPVIPRTTKSFSIKDLISSEETNSSYIADTGKTEPPVKNAFEPKSEFSKEAFAVAWGEFLDHIRGEGTRIVSMFKSITPEAENERRITIHLSNTDQRETFVLNYKHKLISFLENKFNISEIDIDLIVDDTQSTDILYTDEQKYNFLFNKYPVLKEMKKTFNLDLN